MWLSLYACWILCCLFLMVPGYFLAKALRCVAADEDPSELKVRQVMTRRVVSVGPEDSLDEAAKRMAAQQVRRLPVEQDGRLAGMVSLADLTRQPELKMEVAEALSDICDPARKNG